MSFTEFFQDFDISTEDKVKFVLKEIKEGNEENVLEALIGEYQYIQMSATEDVLISLCVRPEISEYQKFSIYTSFFEYCDDKKMTENLISAYIPQDAIREFQTIVWLLTLGGEEHLPRLYKFLMNSNLTDMVRFSQLKSLESRINDTKNFIKKGVDFFYKQDISPRYKILCAQMILEDTEAKPNFGVASSLLETKPNFGVVEKKKDVINDILRISQDLSLDYNTRADATDCVLHYSEVEDQHKALEILNELGGRAKTLYDNKQNAHFVDISKHLEFLQKFEVSVKFDDICKELNNETVVKAFQRISLDIAKYGKSQRYSSKDILERVWSYISNSSNKEVLTQRLVEELQEMVETCSSGHAVRLVNVLSGFEDISIVSFKDQIVSNLSVRMMNCFKNIDNNVEMINTLDYEIDYKQLVFEEMPDQGPIYKKFFIRFLPKIIDDLKKEFVPQYITEDEFDDNIKEAIRIFEGV